MNREDIIRMAREARADLDEGVWLFIDNELMKFAGLIAEDCAKRCDAVADEYQRVESLTFAELKTDAQTGAQDCGAAIREAYKP